ncbi:sigma-54 dependent transcriptional regulator [Desulfatiferula olefinivorans]
MANVLIIDDDTVICDILCEFVQRSGHRVCTEQTLSRGLDRVARETFDVVFLDVNMPDGNGLQAISTIRATASRPEVVIITGAGDPDGAELAIKNGAWDYLQKPFSLNDITLPLTRVMQYRENLENTAPPAVVLKHEGIIGSSQEIHDCLNILAQASRNDANVLITGETGTGKELFARALHANSKRAKGNFVVVDCAALPESLKESALFGHARGAFTGADQAAEGLVKQADGGTLFLDEVGELNPTLQKVFLRVLQEKRFRPVGGKAEVNSDFRLVAATNRNLDAMVKTGHFRSDILYRLKTIAIELPALRRHAEDITEITLFHIKRICRGLAIEVKGCSPDFMNTLTRYKWPGNIRELVNTLEGAVSKAYSEPILFPKHLPDTIRVHVIRSSVDRNMGRNTPETPHAWLVEKAPGDDRRPDSRPPDIDAVMTRSSLMSREEALEKADIRYLRDLMRLTRGNIKESCRISGLGRTRLYTLLKKYNISRTGWSENQAADLP